jgi:hypothetical protein
METGLPKKETLDSIYERIDLCAFVLDLVIFQVKQKQNMEAGETTNDERNWFFCTSLYKGRLLDHFLEFKKLVYFVNINMQIKEKELKEQEPTFLILTNLVTKIKEIEESVQTKFTFLLDSKFLEQNSRTTLTLAEMLMKEEIGDLQLMCIQHAAVLFHRSTKQSFITNMKNQKFFLLQWKTHPSFYLLSWDQLNELWAGIEASSFKNDSGWKESNLTFLNEVQKKLSGSQTTGEPDLYKELSYLPEAEIPNISFQVDYPCSCDEMKIIKHCVLSSPLMKNGKIGNRMQDFFVSEKYGLQEKSLTKPVGEKKQKSLIHGFSRTPPQQEEQQALSLHPRDEIIPETPKTPEKVKEKEKEKEIKEVKEVKEQTLMLTSLMEEDQDSQDEKDDNEILEQRRREEEQQLLKPKRPKKEKEKEKEKKKRNSKSSKRKPRARSASEVPEADTRSYRSRSRSFSPQPPSSKSKLSYRSRTNSKSRSRSSERNREREKEKEKRRKRKSNDSRSHKSKRPNSGERFKSPTSYHQSYRPFDIRFPISKQQNGERPSFPGFSAPIPRQPNVRKSKQVAAAQPKPSLRDPSMIRAVPWL